MPDAEIYNYPFLVVITYPTTRSTLTHAHTRRHRHRIGGRAMSMRAYIYIKCLTCNTPPPEHPASARNQSAKRRVCADLSLSLFLAGSVSLALSLSLSRRLHTDDRLMRAHAPWYPGASKRPSAQLVERNYYITRTNKFSAPQRGTREHANCDARMRARLAHARTHAPRSQSDVVDGDMVAPPHNNAAFARCVCVCR